MVEIISRSSKEFLVAEINRRLSESYKHRRENSVEYDVIEFIGGPFRIGQSINQMILVNHYGIKKLEEQ